MTSYRCVRVPHTPYSPDWAIADFYLFGPLTQQLSGRTLGGEENVIEMITEILNELPKDRAKVHLCIGKKNASASQPIMKSSMRFG
jgi:hypothetical protein